MSQNTISSPEVPQVLQPIPRNEKTLTPITRKKKILSPVPREKNPEIKPDRVNKISLIKIEEQKKNTLEQNIINAAQKGNIVDIFL